ncbi:hypothetical protein G7054_g7250 [Neopestalotiopsis clavispora]|nr:hypothetical protein G7054_g7250 [Neopestalotiopsis clavispora]
MTVAIPTVSAGYHVSPPLPATPELSDCFTIYARHTNGTGIGYLNVDYGASINQVGLSNSIALATKLGLDASTGRLIDYDMSPANGLIASATYYGFTPGIEFHTFAELQDTEHSEYVALDCALSASGLLTGSNPAIPQGFIQYCSGDGNLHVDSRTEPSIELGDCAPLVLRAMAATDCATPTTTTLLPPRTTTTTTTLPTRTNAPKRYYICPTDSQPTLCADGFLVKCGNTAIGANVSWYGFTPTPFGFAQFDCHAACVNDPTCTGWYSYFEEVGLQSCRHTRDVFSQDTTFRFAGDSAYAYSVGVRGFCR